METMQDYSCYCTAEQTQRAYKLGAPIEKFREHEAMSQSIFDKNCVYLYQEGDELVFGYIPTTQQMIGWMREEKHITIVIDQRTENNIPSYRFLLRFHTEEEKDIISDEYYGTWNGIELAAIDASLDYLEKGGNK